MLSSTLQSVLTLDAWWFGDGPYRGYVLVIPRSQLLQRHVFDTWVSGVTHHMDEAQDASFVPGSPVWLSPDPDNPFDSHAVAVWNAARTLHVGWLPAVVVADLEPAHRVGLILSEEREGDQRIALRLLVSREEVELRPVPAPEDAADRIAHVHRHRKWGPAPEPTTDPAAAMSEMLKKLGLPEPRRE